MAMPAAGRNYRKGERRNCKDPVFHLHRIRFAASAVVIMIALMGMTRKAAEKGKTNLTGYVFEWHFVPLAPGPRGPMIFFLDFSCEQSYI